MGRQKRLSTGTAVAEGTHPSAGVPIMSLADRGALSPSSTCVEKRGVSGGNDTCSGAYRSKDGCYGGDERVARVLAVGRNMWESVQTDLVGELRNMVRARDIALTEQRARHVKESVVLQEQRYALANGPHFSAKVAKLFGWTDTTRSASQQSCLCRVSSPALACDESDSQLMVQDEDTKVQGTGRSAREDGVNVIDTNTRQAQGTGGALLVAADKPRNGESHSRTLSVAATANSADADKTDLGRCARCLELQRELDTALTDRTLAEAELVAIRRTVAPADASWELESGGGNGAPKTADVKADSRDQGERAAQNISSPSPLVIMDKTVGLREELGRLERMAAQTNSVVHPESPDNTQTWDREPSALHGGATDRVGLPVRDLVLQPENDAKEGDMQTLTTSLSVSVENSARHFEALARQRLLRIGAEADLRAARTKIDALIPPISPPTCRYSVPENTHGDPGAAVLARSDGRDIVAHEEKSTLEIEKSAHQATSTEVQNTPSVKARSGHATRHQSAEGRGIVSPPGSRGSAGGRGTLPTDITPVKKRVLPTKPATKRKIPSVKDHNVVPVSPPNDCPGYAKSVTRSGFKHAGKSHAGPGRRRPLATAMTADDRGARSRPASTDGKIEGVAEQATDVDAEGLLPRGAIEADLAGGTDGNTPDQSPTLAASFDRSPEDETGNEIEHESPTIENPASSLREQPLAAVSASSEQTGTAVTTSATAEANTPDRVEEGSPKSLPSLPITDKNNNGSGQGESGGGEVCSAATEDFSGVPVVVDHPRSVLKSPQRTTKGGRTMSPGAKHTSDRRAIGRNAKPNQTASPRTPQVRGSSAVRKAIGAKGRPRTTKDFVEQAGSIDTVATPTTHADAPQPDEIPVDDISQTQNDLQPQALNSGNEPGENPTKLLADATKTHADTEVQRSHAVATHKKEGVGAENHGRERKAKLELGKIAINPDSDVACKISTRVAGKGAKTPSPRVVKDARSRTTANANRTSVYGVSVGGDRRGERGVTATTISQEQGRVQGEGPHVRREPGSDISIAGTKKPAGKEVETSPPGERMEEIANEESIATEEDVDVVDTSPLVEHLVEIEQKTLSDHSTCECETAADGTEGDNLSRRRDEKGEGVDCESVVVVTSTDRQNAKGDGCLASFDQEESLRAKVDGLRLEKAELEDTIAHLNVAAAQLYLVEYAQMKEKCHQLRRVVFGPATKPTDEASRIAQSCQEIMYRLKLIGVNFFRRRIGGVMGVSFFPDGLARVLTLMGRHRKAQGCQTATAGTGPWRENDGLATPARKDACVQVAGGIDEEDEPLMEQQVYALLGRLDLLLRKREEALSAYHRDAEEGAREARALLAAAVTQHQSGRGWGVSCAPNAPELVGGRQGPAGAPRPALNPTNLLFTAAVVLDGIAKVAPVAPGSTSRATSMTVSEVAAVSNGVESRRHRYSPAETSLLELSDEVVAALEVEQRRSDASAERRRFAAEAYNHHRNGESLGKPPAGVPPLIWGMGLHLVGKLARAFRMAVEARAFEREVADADLVAAVTLGRSSGDGEVEGPPRHLDHRMLSAMQGSEERRNEGRCSGSNRAEGEPNEAMCWGVENYHNFRSDRPRSGNVGVGRTHSRNRTPPGSSMRVSDCMYENPGRRTRENAARNSYNSTPNSRLAMSGGASQTTIAGPACANTKTSTVHYSRSGTTETRKSQHPFDVSAAVARVEAAVFGTVKPSRLHPRPTSASAEGRTRLDRSSDETYIPKIERGYSGQREINENGRPRPQSARPAAPRDFGDDEAGRIPNGSTSARERWAHEEGNAGTNRRHVSRSPTTPTPPRARPVSAGGAVSRAGGRLVDTRTWSSHAVQPPVFRCRPQNKVRFEGDGAESPPTHAGAVPEFLLRKERHLAEREKAAAVKGRFALVSPHGYGETDEAGASRTPRSVAVDNGDPRRPVEAETSVREVKCEWGETGLDGGVAYGSSAISSTVKLEESMDGEGLLPDAGEQAFFDTWKPTGYGSDLSRYD